MNSSFSISVDAPRNLVRITLSGFFTGPEIARFAEARDEAHKLLRGNGNAHLTLVDTRDLSIQAQESVAAFGKAMADPAVVSKRIAFVVARSLARTQIKRITAHRNARYFMDAEAAERWLFED